MNWSRVAWLFAVYAVYLSVRSVPATVREVLPEKLKKLFSRQQTPA